MKFNVAFASAAVLSVCGSHRLNIQHKTPATLQQKVLTDSTIATNAEDVYAYDEKRLSGRRIVEAAGVADKHNRKGAAVDHFTSEDRDGTNEEIIDIVRMKSGSVAELDDLFHSKASTPIGRHISMEAMDHTDAKDTEGFRGHQFSILPKTLTTFQHKVLPDSTIAKIAGGLYAYDEERLSGRRIVEAAGVADKHNQKGAAVDHFMSENPDATYDEVIDMILKKAESVAELDDLFHSKASTPIGRHISMDDHNDNGWLRIAWNESKRFIDGMANSVLGCVCVVWGRMRSVF